MNLAKIGKNGKPLAAGSRAKAIALLDKKTGLMWAAQDLAGRHNWADAKKVAAEAGIAGFDDWRLPTIEELESLRDRTLYRPAADPALCLQSDWYWSSTPDASSPSDYAWSVNFYYGSSYYSYQYYEGLVRPVRSARARQ
jgi:hypothetical protein